MKRYFLTGITGSLGKTVTRMLLKDPDVHVVGYSRDEFKQQQMEKHPRLTLVLGDVRDQRRLIESTRNIDMIFHFAALKHIDILELNPEESIQTNIYGTENILGAQRINRIPRVVLSSTDKAAYPINVYGNCKALSEKLVLRNENNIVCRYGNVLASRGSVVPIFVESLKKEHCVYVTHREMTRFFLTVEQAAQFVLQQAFFGNTGGLKIPNLKATRVIEVARAIAEILGITNYDVKEVGIRLGEKIHEALKTEFEGGAIYSDSSPAYSCDELVQLLTPIVKEQCPA